MNIGRNEKCPCGSGLKYKKCHLGKDFDMKKQKRYRHFSGVVFDDSGANLSLYEKNMTLIEAITDIFGFTEGKDFSDIKREVSRDKVAELHKLIAWLWPPDTDISKFLPSPSNNLRALYMGNMRPQTILRSVGRYSLYCDEILVMDPFMNPWFIAPDYNPIMHPEEYVANTWKWVLFTIQLAPWIYDKQVLLLPNPIDFDSKLRKDMWANAEARLGPEKGNLIKFLEEDDSMDEFAQEDFKRTWMSIPEDAQRRKIKEFDPKLSDKDVDGMIDFINRMKQQDPYFVNNPNEKGNFGITTHTMGGSLEQGLYISQLTGAHLYTDFEFRWREILSAQTESTEESPWSPITYGFQKLDFRFLDSANLQFVHEIKADGRLSNLRNFLRKTWSEISSDEQTSYEQANKLALEFADELKEQYAKTETEWEVIDDKLRNWLLSRSGLGALIATGGVDWVIPALGFALDGVNSLLNAKFERKNFKRNVPLSVFLDLKKSQKLK